MDNVVKATIDLDEAVTVWHNRRGDGLWHVVLDRPSTLEAPEAFRVHIAEFVSEDEAQGRAAAIRAVLWAWSIPPNELSTVDALGIVESYRSERYLG